MRSPPENSPPITKRRAVFLFHAASLFALRHEQAFSPVAHWSLTVGHIARSVGERRDKICRAGHTSSRNDVGPPTFPSRHPCNRIDDVARRTPGPVERGSRHDPKGETAMPLIAGLLGYLAVLALLIGGTFAALLAVSPGITTQSKVAAYGAPTRVRAASEFAIAAPAAPQRIGPPVVHRAPEPPSQAEIAKLRLQASGREMKQSVSAQRRPHAPPVDTARSAAPEPARFDARHSSNF